MKTLRIAFTVILTCFTFVLAAQEQLTIDSPSPNVNGVDQNGEKFSLTEALKDGPVVVSFYRGSWCPYCMKQFKEVQERYSEISGNGAQFIAVTPDNAQGIQKTVKMIKPSFKILRDSDLLISHDFKVLADEKYEQFNGELGNGRKFLPVTATYVIGQDGKIKFSYFDGNHRVRAHFDDVVQTLKQIK